ncbi:MAG TPA: chloride channel protein [Thermoanaerobaculia bacterium]|nr:chloride channel protein [Thermoanaerobaculia bacterium]
MAKRLAALWDRLRKSLKSFDFTVARRFGLATREDRVFYLLIAGVGAMAGVLGVFVHTLMENLQALLWGSSGPLLEIAQRVPWWRVVAAPAVGGLLVGLVYWAARLPAAGGGMSQLIEAVALLGGKVPPRPVVVNALAAVATVGSGGSLGREGPMIRLGAMVASWTGSRLGLPTHRVKILVGCGAAAGLAAAYNIPVGGAIFAMEVILGNFALEIFGPIVVASVISTLIARALAGNVPIYAAPGYVLESGWEILAYAGLGIVGALASVAFILGVRAGRGLFARLTWLPVPLRPLLGMTLLGALGVGAPHVLGGGSEMINLALAGKLDLSPQLGGALLLLALPLAKLLATALTTGGGGSGGLFAPSLLFGALVGGGYGYWVHTLWPQQTSPYGAYAAVGMAAVAAGTSHAPISAILILFEFTGNYDLILPLMIAAILASALSRKLHPSSMYTESLRRRGVDLSWRMEEAVLAGLHAADLARPDTDVLRPADGYKRVVEKFLGTRRQRLFVVGEDGRLLGAISLHDIKHALDAPEALTHVFAHDLMLPVRQVVQSDERLHSATRALGASDFERLPVVEPSGKFVGVLAKKDLLAVYAQEVLGRPALLATFVSGRDGRASRDYVELPPDFAVRLVPVPEELVGKTLAEANLPQTIGARVIEIKRNGRTGEERVIPDAQTVLARGDELVLLGPTAALEAMKAS